MTGPEHFVDTHVHFWTLRHPLLRYGFLTDESTHPIIGDIDGVRVQRFSVREFEAQTRFHDVTGVVHVEVAFDSPDPVAETAWLQDLANETGRPNGVLAYCDFSAPDAGEQLERHRAHAVLRGFRGRDDVHLFDDPAWRKGYGLLAGTDLLFAHTVGWENIGHAQRLAADFPDVTFCLDQAGMPLARDAAYFRSWHTALAQLARQDNTVCKISSLGMGDPHWTVGSLRPWIIACVDTFGPERCFFGSNWPMDSLFSSYGDLVDAYREVVTQYSAAEQTALLSGNAERLFRL